MGFIKENRKVSVEVDEAFYAKAICDACEKSIDIVYEQNPKDGLTINFCGGFGMYNQDLFLETVLCNECIEKLWETFPKLKSFYIKHCKDNFIDYED